MRRWQLCLRNRNLKCKTTMRTPSHLPGERGREILRRVAVRADDDNGRGRRSIRQRSRGLRCGRSGHDNLTLAVWTADNLTRGRRIDQHRPATVRATHFHTRSRWRRRLRIQLRIRLRSGNRKHVATAWAAYTLPGRRLRDFQGFIAFRTANGNQRSVPSARATELTSAQITS